MKHVDKDGVWKVMRDCCTSGNCFECYDKSPLGKPIRIEHATGYTKERAEKVAALWGKYNATVVRVS